MKPKVLITRPVQQAAIDEVAKHCQVQVHLVDEPMPPEVLAKAMAGRRCGNALRSESRQRGHRRRCRNCGWSRTSGQAYDNIDVDACTRRRILVTNTPDVLTEATADVAFALALAAARRVVEADRVVREGHWPHWQWNFYVGLGDAWENFGSLRIRPHWPGDGSSRTGVLDANPLPHA